MSKIKIVYGSGGGNTELVCQKVAEVLSENKSHPHKVELLQAKLTDATKLKGFDLLILASPTYGHGLLESYFEKFLRALAAVDLRDKPCSVIGLGDPKYDSDYHIESIKIIMDFLKEKGAKIVHIPLRVSRCPLPLLTGHVDLWAKKIAEMV